MRRQSLWLSLLLLSLLALPHRAYSSNAEECSSLGFDSELVLCSDCDVLEETVHDADLTGECRRCCVAGEAGDQTAGIVWTRAHLECDQWQLKPYPELLDFYDHRTAELVKRGFNGMVYGSSYRSPPLLVLRRLKEEAAKDGKPAEVKVNVANWKADQLEAFLKERLAPLKC